MKRKEQLLQSQAEKSWDILVIGGGASGLGVALDAISRGLSVCLVEKYDFGKGTSSRSTKLIHGGVRYLEQGNIRLVREALQERKYMLDKADHLSRKQPFILPCYSIIKAIYFYIGLKVYDLLSGTKSIGDTKWLSSKKVKQLITNINPKGLVGGIRYMDGQFDDTRLCIDLVKTIIERGGTCINHVGVIKLVKDRKNVVGAVVKDELTNQEWQITADHIVNAAGIFTDDIVHMDNPTSRNTIIPSRGSHIVLDQEFLGGIDAIMIPKTSDGRVLFVIPWNGKVIAGTTDEKTDIPVAEPKATMEEIEFILANCRKYLLKDPTKEDIRATYAGLRPLAAPKEGNHKTKEISRGHRVIFSDSGLVSIIGGKWTTFRKMGEDVISTIAKERNEKWKSSTSKNIYIKGRGIYSKSDTIHPSLPYSMADIIDIVNNEMVETLEDLLLRRTRCILLDVEATRQIAPIVGKKLQSHLNESNEWLSFQLQNIHKLLNIYSINNSSI